ncbi:MAG: AraC family transcriptional regulator ligand-binding domain-containing protein [Moraxellaceae bacterium]
MQALSPRLSFPVAYVETTQALIRAYRGSPDACYERLNLSAETPLAPDSRLSAEQFEQLMLLCLEHLPAGEPRFIQALHYVPTTAHGLVGIAAMTADSLGDALDLTIRYFALLMPCYELYYHDFRGEVHVVFKTMYSFRPQVQQFLTEMMIGSIGRIAKFAHHPQVSSQSHCSAICMQVQLTHACDADPLAYERYFGYPVKFNCRENKFIISRQVLQQPLVTCNRTTRIALEMVLKQQLAALPHHQSITQLVRQFLMQSLNQGRLPSAHETAEHFAMSVRTLSRRLRDDQMSWIELSQQVRMDRARQLLLDGTMPLSKIAQILGFSSNASFSRAFRQAVGRTPREFRKLPFELAPKA